MQIVDKSSIVNSTQLVEVLVGYILIVLLEKGRSARCLYHFAILQQLCQYLWRNYWISVQYWEIYKVYNGLWTEVVNVNFFVCKLQQICSFHRFVTVNCCIFRNRLHVTTLSSFNHKQTDSLLLLFHHHLKTPNLLWRFANWFQVDAGPVSVHAAVTSKASRLQANYTCAAVSNHCFSDCRTFCLRANSNLQGYWYDWYETLKVNELLKNYQ